MSKSIKNINTKNITKEYEKNLKNLILAHRYRIYLRLRKEVDKIKKKHGFKCKFPKCYCCTSKLSFYYEDYIFLNRKNLDAYGLEPTKFKDVENDISLIYDDSDLTCFCSIDKKEIIKDGKKILRSGYCYYQIINENGEGMGCKLHPDNPLLCHTFPIVFLLHERYILNKAEECKQKSKLKLKEKEWDKLYKLILEFNKYNQYFQIKGNND